MVSDQIVGFGLDPPYKNAPAAGRQRMIGGEFQRCAGRRPQRCAIVRSQALLAQQNTRGLRGSAQTEAGELDDRFDLGPAVKKVTGFVEPNSLGFLSQQNTCPAVRDGLGTILYIYSDPALRHTNCDHVSAVRDRALKAAPGEPWAAATIKSKADIAGITVELAGGEAADCASTDCEPVLVIAVSQFSDAPALGGCQKFMQHKPALGANHRERTNHNRSLGVPVIDAHESIVSRPHIRLQTTLGKGNDE